MFLTHTYVHAHHDMSVDNMNLQMNKLVTIEEVEHQ